MNNKSSYGKNSFLKLTDTKAEQLKKLEYMVSELRDNPTRFAFIALNDIIEKCIELKFKGIKLTQMHCDMFNVIYKKMNVECRMNKL